MPDLLRRYREQVIQLDLVNAELDGPPATELNALPTVSFGP